MSDAHMVWTPKKQATGGGDHVVAEGSSWAAVIDNILASLASKRSAGRSANVVEAEWEAGS